MELREKVRKKRKLHTGLLLSRDTKPIQVARSLRQLSSGNSNYCWGELSIQLATSRDRRRDVGGGCNSVFQLLGRKKLI